MLGTGAIKTELEADGTKLDHIWEMTEDDAGIRRLTTNALEQAPSGGLNAQQTRDAMKLAPSEGVPSSGSVDKHLDDIVEDTGDLQTNQGNWATATGFATPTNITAGTIASVTNRVGADVEAISGDTTAADNLELQYDGTGLTGDEFPSTQAQVGLISSGAAATNTTAESVTITTGSETGTYESTSERNDVLHSVTPVEGTIDFYYQFDVGENGLPVEVAWDGYANGNGDTYDVYAYNWSAAGWEQVGIRAGLNGTTIAMEVVSLTIAHVGTGVNVGKVRLRIYSTDGTNVSTDRILCAFTAIAPTVTEIRTEMDNNSTKMAPSQTLNEYKATGFATPTNITAGTITTVTNAVTVGNPNDCKATGFSTHNATAVKTAMEAVGSKLTSVKTQTDKLTFAAGNDVKATLDNEEVITDAASRTASKATGFNTVVPDPAGTAATPGEVATALTDIHLDKLYAADYDPANKPGVATAQLNELVENDGGVSRFTANALEQAPSGTGGDASEAKQDTIIAHLTDVKGGTFAGATDSLEALRNRGDAAWTTGEGAAGAGAITWTYTLTDSVSGDPIAGADVWATSDVDGSNVVASGVTDVNGKVTFHLDAATYYIWRQLSGWNFVNPDEEVVS